MSKVFVSGATGFLAGHIIQLLLKRGYQVVGSVRSLKNEKKLEHLKKMQPQQNLTIVEASLTDKECWVDLMVGCDYLIHTASPVPIKQSKNPDQEILKPAIEGAENVINAAIKNNIIKIVQTSSVGAIFSGRNDKNIFTEKDWSDPKNCPPYEASKHFAEKKAWELVENHQKNGGKIQLSVINPTFIQGPSLSSNNDFLSGNFVNQMMTNKIPGLAKISTGFVDVRDVALAHVNAMERDVANGKRYILAEGTYWLEDISSILRDEFERFKYKITSKIFGSFMLSFAALFNDEAKLMKPYLGRFFLFDNSASQQDLSIRYKTTRETILDTVYQQIEQSRIPNKLPKNHKKSYETTQFTDLYK